MAMARDEYEANRKVQNLKSSVDRAERISGSSRRLRRLSGTDLALLISNVSNSVKYRKSLRTLGADGGHEHRILIEEAILATLTNEAARRSERQRRQRILEEDARMRSLPSLPSNSTWGKKKEE